MSHYTFHRSHATIGVFDQTTKEIEHITVIKDLGNQIIDEMKYIYPHKYVYQVGAVNLDL